MARHPETNHAERLHGDAALLIIDVQKPSTIPVSTTMSNAGICRIGVSPHRAITAFDAALFGMIGLSFAVR